MRLKQHAGPIVFILLLIACVVGAGAVLAVEPRHPLPIPVPVAQGSGSAQIPAPHYTPRQSHNNIVQDLPEQQSDGSLQIPSKNGEALFCPLKHTDVNAEVSGFLARVKVTQEFTNPSSDKVEAIYTFPLPQNAAVDDMTMRVGDRTIKGLIKRREEAQKIYQQAVQAGHTAALLDQERPNIFTQSVGNIPPGASVKVEISYIEVLKYDAGSYEFVYPMVVGPRYVPGNPTGQQAGGWSPDTDQVPDASRITPPVAGVHYGKKGTRAGHDISVAVKLDAGVIIKDLQSPTHEIDKQLPSARTAAVKLRNEKEIPNRDFVLRYEVAGEKIEDALLTHRQAILADCKEPGCMDGYFTFILQPPDRVKDEDASSRELIFVLDTSGSMSGYPIETAKSVMKRAIEHMRPQDTFNLVTFAGDTHVLFPQPVPSSAANIAQATAFLAGRHGGGGTEMMKAIRVALGDDGSGISECSATNDCALTTQQPRTSGDPIRIVCFMTDGYVGNDMEIISAIQKHPEARVFSFGIGSSVNRFLLDKMAEAGRGEVEYVLNDKQAPEAADRFYERVHTPVLTDVSIDWQGLPVTDVYPKTLLDLFTAKPLTLAGRYSRAASGSITLRGKRAGKPFERTIKVDLPQTAASNQALAQLWARTKIDELMSQDWKGMQTRNARKEIEEQITQLGLDYRLMTQFTSFVAVEEQTVVEGGRTRTIQVPVEMPQGVRAEGVFGLSRDEAQVLAQSTAGFSPSFAKNGVASETVEVTASAVTVDPTSSSTTYTQSLDAPPYKAPYYEGEPRRAKSQPKSLAPRELKDEALAGKLHRDLLEVVKCADRKRKCDGVANGKVHVEVWFERSLTRTELEQLFAAGLAPDQNKNVLLAAKQTSVRGTIAVEKIGILAAQAGVRLISLAK